MKNRLMFAKGEGEEKGMGYEFGVSKCKLLYSDWINTRSYYIAQGNISNILGKTMMEKNIKSTYICICTYTYIYTHTHTYTYIYTYTHTHIYMYIWRERESFSYTVELVQHCKSTIL